VDGLFAVLDPVTLSVICSPMQAPQGFNDKAWLQVTRGRYGSCVDLVCKDPMGWHRLAFNYASTMNGKPRSQLQVSKIRDPQFRLRNTFPDVPLRTLVA